MYKLFLDDMRDPWDCASYMHTRIGAKNPIYLEPDWIIARSYNQFVKTVEEQGIPTTVSFDHDLGDEFRFKTDKKIIIPPEEAEIDYDAYEEKTGYHCAEWLINHCIEKGAQLPEVFIHSANPAGVDNINFLFRAYEKRKDDHGAV